MPIKFDAAVVLGSYHAGLRKLIYQMKKPTHAAISRTMGDLLAERRKEILASYSPDLIVPVPMYWSRRLQRGINSPDVLARCLAKSLQIPVRGDVLARCSNTRPQYALSPTRRFENVRGAFRVKNPEVTQNARVLLVDDVLTTGATCSEAAKMLKRAGASTVVVAVVARAQGRNA